MIALQAVNAAKLKGIARREIRRFHDAAWAIAARKPRPQWEPHFVAGLCLSMGNIVGRWQPRLRRILGRNVWLTADVIFTHQTPLVTWPPTIRTSRCELADVLVAFVDRTSSKREGRAILVQGKQSDSQKLTLVSSSEKAQFQLLSTRPVFDLVAKGAPKNVNLAGRQPDVGLLYGLTPPDGQPVNSGSWGRARWHSVGSLQSCASKAVRATDDFAGTLVDLLQGQTGWSFDLPPTNADWTHFVSAQNRDDWSMLVNHLLERTFARRPKVLLAGGGSGRRHEQYCLLYEPSDSNVPLGFGLISDAVDRVPSRLVAELVNGHMGPNFARAVLGHVFDGGGDQNIERPRGDDDADGPISAILLSLNNDERQPE
jgi:hypothetical protein